MEQPKSSHGDACLKEKVAIEEKSNKYSYACCIIASMISILMGYDTGVMSGAMLYIKDEFKISDSKNEVLAGILSLCAILGSLTAGRTSDFFGRRLTIVLASTIFFAGSLIMGLAPNYAALFAGRCVAGVGVGYALMIAPVYSAEISSPSSRGLLTSLPEMCISSGILLGYISNFFLSSLPLKYGWRTMLGLAVVPSAVLAVSVLAMPESPRWLAMQGRIEEAKSVLLKVTNTEEEAERRLQEIKAAAAESKDGGGRGVGVWKELIVRPSHSVKRILVAVMGIHFFQHATGIEAVVLYSPRIFEKAGVRTRRNLLLASMGVGVTKTGFIFVAAFLLDRVGRRPLLLASVAGMVVCLTGLGFGLTMAGRETGDLTWEVPFCISTLLVNLAFYSSGLAPITWVYSSEVFPLRLRAQGASLGVAMNRLMNGVVSMSFLSISEAMTIGGAFFMFAAIAVVAWFFFYLLYPETRGRSLEDMEEVFSRGWFSAAAVCRRSEGSREEFEMGRVESGAVGSNKV